MASNRSLLALVLIVVLAFASATASVEAPDQRPARKLLQFFRFGGSVAPRRYYNNYNYGYNNYGYRNYGCYDYYSYYSYYGCNRGATSVAIAGGGPIAGAYTGGYRRASATAVAGR